jgi:hypothetical protein
VDIICYGVALLRKVTLHKANAMRQIIRGVFLLLLVASRFLQAQTSPFQIELEPYPIDGLPGVQSYAQGEYNGEWVILGGRTDGLHRRQPWATFDEAGNNRDILVIDPGSKQIWHASLDPLPLHLQDQLSSTNMEFHQEGPTLYVMGGYGHSRTIDSKLTYAMLTAVDLPGLVAAIKANGDITPYFRSLTDTGFAVTGGHLKKIGDTWYIVGGQNFEGNYNPMGHGTFVQTYTDAIRRFRLEDDGTTMSVAHLSPWVDSAALHRRDYNVVNQIFPDGKAGFTAFAGPFRPDADLPFIDVVNATPDGYAVDPDFAQYYNHYHCATLPLYDEETNEMHSLFFGGIAQYYESEGMLVQDNDVPFVKTIARVTRTADGRMTEYKLPVEMPGYLGASAEFILDPDVPRDEYGIIRMGELPAERTLLGYIFGGIESSAPNIFWINTGTESIATPKIFKVYITTSPVTSVDRVNAQSLNGLQLQVYPNPTEGLMTLRFRIDEPGPTRLLITDTQGKQLLSEDITTLVVRGENVLQRTCQQLKPGMVCMVSVMHDGKQVTQRVVVKE